MRDFVRFIITGWSPGVATTLPYECPSKLFVLGNGRIMRSVALQGSPSLYRVSSAYMLQNKKQGVALCVGQLS